MPIYFGRRYTLTHTMTPPTTENPLPFLDVPTSPDDIVARLDTASRRGRMPGFHARPPGALFQTDAWGTPFDSDLFAGAETRDAGTRLNFEVRLRRRLPGIYAVLLVLTVWPGAPLTDSLLRMWFDWYHHLTQMNFFKAGSFEWFTYAWYIPVCVLPLPFMWRGWMRRSHVSARVSALDMIAKIACELGVPAPPGASSAVGSQQPSPPAGEGGCAAGE